jgi:DNA-binding MarR family transcriptional regulator
MVLRITEKGESVVRELLPRLWGPLQEMMRDFSESEQNQLLSLLKRVGGLLDAAPAALQEHRA